MNCFELHKHISKFEYEKYENMKMNSPKTTWHWCEALLVVKVYIGVALRYFKNNNGKYVKF